MCNLLKTIAVLPSLFACALACQAATPTQPAAQSSQSDSATQSVEKYAAMMDRINLAARNSDFASLRSAAETVQKEWVIKDPNQYGRLMLRIVQELNQNKSAYDPAQRSELKMKYALAALKLRDRFPLEVEVHIVEQLDQPLFGGNAKTAQERSLLRSQFAPLWFHAWKRTVDALDPKWDPEKDGPGYVPLPDVDGPGFGNGMSPDEISDPVERQRYKDALAENAKRRQRSIDQYDAQKLTKEFVPKAETAIVRAYSQSPANSDEISQLLIIYISDQKIQDRIKAEIQTPAEPKDATTRPDLGKPAE